MKKISTLFILIFAVTCCIAQNKICKGIKPLPIKSPTKNVAVPVKSIVIDENKNNISSAATQAPVQKIPGTNNSIASTGLIIGHTTYGLQSNGSIGNKIYKSGNNLGVVWNFSTDASGTFADRGTGYNFSNDNGTTWQPFPITRIESDRRGFPIIDHLTSGGEVFVSHNPTVPPIVGNGVKLSSRSSLGTGPWTEAQVPPAIDDNSIVFLWPRMKTGGSNGNTIHEIDLSLPVGNSGVIYHGIDGVLTYSRSDDAGLTWNIQHQILPGMDSTRYYGVRGESYAIDVKDSIVAICQGDFTNDWAMWKSTDNGNTWTKTVIDSFIQVANPDTITTVGGLGEVLIDNNGTIHCFESRSKILIDTTMGTLGYFPFEDGLLYWNENFGANPSVTIASAYDIDGNGIINITSPPDYNGLPITTMPTAGTDTSGNIFVTYSSVHENNIYSSTSENFRHVYCIGSPDNGVTWSTPYDISNVYDKEDAYSSMAKEVDDKVNVVWQRDTVPGVLTILPYSDNDIFYRSVSTSLILNGLSVSSVTIGGNIFFDSNTNKIKDAGEINLQGQKVLLMPDSVFTYTDTAGNYKFNVYSGNYTIKYIPDLNWQTTTDSISFTAAVSGLSLTGFDFGSNFVNGINTMNSFLSSAFPHCGFLIPYAQTFRNTGTNFINGEVKMIIDPLDTFVSSVPVPNSISGDTLRWNYMNLAPFEQRNINLQMLVPGPAFSGTMLTTTSVVSYDSMSVLVPLNYDTLINWVACSNDPNDKTVDPAGIGPNHLTLMNEKLKYTIRFQNTGTDTAFKVVIFDTLSAALDINTFEVLNSSHP
ncbi:MAG: hypothetical protein ABI855_11765, partial [Bacteroidota bacterium]